jgi:hypothetical protein
LIFLLKIIYIINRGRFFFVFLGVMGSLLCALCDVNVKTLAIQAAISHGLI